MSAYAATYVTIGTTVLRTRAIDCTDWSDLLASPSRGRDRPIPGQAGAAVRPRVDDVVRAALPVRLHGGYDDNTWLGGDLETQHARIYTHLAVLYALKGEGTLTFTWPSGSASGTCIVESVETPRFDSAAIALAVLDVTLPDGPLGLT